MKIQRYRYAFRSRSGHCYFEGFYPQMTGGGAREAAVNRLLLHLWKPDERSGCKGTSEVSYRQQTDFRVVASNEHVLSFRFEVRGTFEREGAPLERRVEGFTVDLEHARELTPFRRALYDTLLERAEGRVAAAGAPRPNGFFVRPSGIVLLFGDTREVHVPWDRVRDIADTIAPFRAFLAAPPASASPSAETPSA